MNVTRINFPVVDGASSSRAPDVRNRPDIRLGDDTASAGSGRVPAENTQQAVDTLNSVLKSLDKTISFSFHEKTQRVIMKVQDATTHETIREIPPKEMIRLLEHMHELVGVFVDESR